MAFTFVNKATQGFDTASTTLAIDCTGADLLVVSVVTDGNAAVSGTPTYAGSNLTLYGNTGTAGYDVWLYYKVSPATGSNNISVTLGSGTDAGIMAVAYSGVDTASPTDGTYGGARDTASPFGRAITTNSANSLVVMASGDDDGTAAARTPLAGTTERHDVILGSGAGDFGGYFADILDAGAAGSKTITYTDASVSDATCVIGAFKTSTGASGQTVTPNAIASTTTFYSPTITTGPVTVAPNAIASITTVHSPTVTSLYRVFPGAISSTTTVHSPTVTTGGVTVTPNHLASTTTVHNPLVTTGNLIVEPLLLASTTTFYAPTVTTGAVSITPNLLGSSTTIYSPTVVGQGITITAGHIASTTTVFSPIISTMATSPLAPILVSTQKKSYDFTLSKPTVTATAQQSSTSLSVTKPVVSLTATKSSAREVQVNQKRTSVTVE